jgi:hypothetical protein
MWKKNKGIVLFLLLFFCSFSYGQIKDHYYKRTLNGVNDRWHKIVLPVEMYARISNDFSDLRIYGLSQNGDTSEVPYTLQVPDAKIVTKELDFNLINIVAKSDGFYFTFELTQQMLINEIILSFVEQNYDWKLKLEGSQDLTEWFTLVDDYRILAIKNSITDYQFSKVIFPSSKFKYYRFCIKSEEKPTLSQAKVLTKQKSNSSLSLRSSKYIITEDKKDKTTTIDINLSAYVPISEVAFYGDKKVEFYRPFELKILRDSSKLASGMWMHHFQSVMTGTLSSLDENRFSFNHIWAKHLRLIIQNHDNAPIKIDSLQVLGADYTISGRFDIMGIPYYLVYGDKRLQKPIYDIAHFTAPDSVVRLELGKEEIIVINEASPTTPLFENKWWLWILMVAIILALGSLTFKMMART